MITSSYITYIYSLVYCCSTSLTPEATMQTLLSFLLIFTLPIVSHGYFGYFWDSADPEEKLDVGSELQNLKERIAVLEDGLSALQNKSNIVCEYMM